LAELLPGQEETFLSPDGTVNEYPRGDASLPVGSAAESGLVEPGRCPLWPPDSNPKEDFPFAHFLRAFPTGPFTPLNLHPPEVEQAALLCDVRNECGTDKHWTVSFTKQTVLSWSCFTGCVVVVSLFAEVEVDNFA